MLKIFSVLLTNLAILKSVAGCLMRSILVLRMKTETADYLQSGSPMIGPSVHYKLSLHKSTSFHDVDAFFVNHIWINIRQ